MDGHYWGLLLGWLGGGCPVSICQHINDRDLAGNGAPFVWGRDYAFDRACWHRDQIKAILSNKRDIAILVIFAFLGNFNSQLTYMLAVQTSNASTATIIQYLSPVLIILWLAFRNREWPRRIDVISIIFALVGTFLLVTGGRLDALTITPNALMWGSAQPWRRQSTP